MISQNLISYFFLKAQFVFQKLNRIVVRLNVKFKTCKKIKIIKNLFTNFEFFFKTKNIKKYIIK
jgi:hypothetical protein